MDNQLNFETTKIKHDLSGEIIQAPVVISHTKAAGFFDNYHAKLRVLVDTHTQLHSVGRLKGSSANPQVFVAQGSQPKGKFGRPKGSQNKKNTADKLVIANKAELQTAE